MILSDAQVLCPCCACAIDGRAASEALSHVGQYPCDHAHAVTQDTVGFPRGGCVRAGYASLLGLPLEAVPRLDPEANDVTGVPQQIRERQFLRANGLLIVEITAVGDQLPDAVLASAPPVFHTMTGLSPRGFQHRVVGFGGQIAHDPHPDRSGIFYCNAVGFLAPRCETCEMLCAGGHR